MDRHGLAQVVQTRLRTASVDSEKLEWEVSSACCWASSTDLSRAPQSPHLSDTPAMDDGSLSFSNLNRMGIGIACCSSFYYSPCLAIGLLDPQWCRDVWWMESTFYFLFYIRHYSNFNQPDQFYNKCSLLSLVP